MFILQQTMIYAFKNRNNKNTNLKINNDTKYSIRNKKEINLFINCLIEKKTAIFGEDFSGIIGKYIIISFTGKN